MAGRGRRTRHPAEMEPRAGSAAPDRFLRLQRARWPASRLRQRPDAEIVGGRVDEGVAPPHPSQTRMCSFPASGSSWESLARGGVDDTIRDSSGKKGRRWESHFVAFPPVQLSVVVSWTGL